MLKFKLRHIRPIAFDVFFQPEVGQTRLIKSGLRMMQAVDLAEDTMKRHGGKAWFAPA